MTYRSKLVGLAAAAVMAMAGAGVAQLATAAPAAAVAPCQRYWGWNNGTIFCNSGDQNWSGYVFRVVITCVHAGAPYTVYGPWVPANTTSTAYCGTDDSLQSTTYPPSVTWELG